MLFGAYSGVFHEMWKYEWGRASLEGGRAHMGIAQFKWTCTECKDTLAGFSEEGLETLKQLHIEHHARTGTLYTELFLIRTRLQDPVTGEWKSWDDRKFLADCGIDAAARDKRTPEEIAGRVQATGESQ